MSDLTEKTLAQVRNALDYIEEQREVVGLKKNDKLLLEQAALALRNMERSIVREKEQDLVTVLEQDSKALMDLTQKITNASKKLEDLAVILGKTSAVVEGLIKIITTAVGAGLI